MGIELISVLVFVVFCLLLAAFVFCQSRNRKDLEKDFPKWWVTKGEAPPMTGVALDVIREDTPGMKYYGTIEWVKEPFTDPFSGSHLLAGEVLSFYPPYIKLVYFEKPENSALAHEIGHVWRQQTGQSNTEPADDPQFAKWLYEVNAKIAKAIGH